MSRALCVAKECYLKNACLCNWPFSRFEDSVSMDSQCIFSDFGLKKKKNEINYQHVCQLSTIPSVSADKEGRR